MTPADRASLPSWERGLKSLENNRSRGEKIVAPFVGAWIEINLAQTLSFCSLVAPFVGAWIEIKCLYTNCGTSIGRSLRGSVD